MSEGLELLKPARDLRLVDQFDDKQGRAQIGLIFSTNVEALAVEASPNKLHLDVDTWPTKQEAKLAIDQKSGNEADPEPLENKATTGFVSGIPSLNA